MARPGASSPYGSDLKKIDSIRMIPGRGFKAKLRSSIFGGQSAKRQRTSKSKGRQSRARTMETSRGSGYKKGTRVLHFRDVGASSFIKYRVTPVAWENGSDQAKESVFGDSFLLGPSPHEGPQPVP